jgi:Ca2+-binding RTX toxin-like protein
MAYNGPAVLLDGSFPESGLYPKTPMYLDILTAHRVYGDVDIFTVDDIYNVDADSLMTIWDDGGSDTIVWTGAGARLSLRFYAAGADVNPTANLGWSGIDSGPFDQADWRFFIAPGSQIENLTGGSGNDWLEGNGADNILQGRAGQDHLDGGNGSDTADFTDRNYISWLVDLAAGTATAVAGGSGTDTLTNIENVATSGGSDTLYGDNNANVLLGGDGSDTLDGRGGTDAMDGGPGDDTFIYALGNGTDIIANFVTGPGNVDEIDLRQITSIHSLADVLARTTQINPTTVMITFGPGDTLMLQNVNWGNVSADDFIFAPANDTTAARLTTTGPRDNDTGVAVDSNIGLVFDEAVQRGSGDINIFNANGTLFHRIPVTDTTQVTVSGASVTINPSVSFAAGADYYVTMGSGVIRDLAGNLFQGIESGELNFTTASGSGPPANDAVYVQILDNSIPENAGGDLTTLSFGVVLTGPGAGTRTVSVQYTTEDIVGSSARAFAGVDYVATSGVLVIPQGQTTGTIDVRLIGDTAFEPSEVFRLNLSQPSPGVTLLNNSATGTIINDDAVPNLRPVTQTDLAIIGPNTQGVIDVLANDSDPDGDYPLRVTQIGFQSGPGTIIPGPGGANVLFTPSTGFTGVVSFFYVISDAEGGNDGFQNGFANVIVAGDGTPGVTQTGGEGDDILSGRGGNDTLSGGPGDDVIMGGPGADRIDGGPGFDYLDLRQAAHGATFRITDLWVWDDGDGGQDVLQNIEGILGTAFNDSIDGQSGTAAHVFTNFRFYGNDGDDVLKSQDGDDYLEGGPGNDEIWFEAGRDIVFGGLGNDRIFANNAPTDSLPDLLDGGPGDDVIWATGGWEVGGSADSLFGGDGHDDLSFWNGDVASGGSGRDTFRFGGPISTTAYHAWVTDLTAGEEIRWEFQTPVVVDNSAYWFIGPISAGDGLGTQLNHVEYAAANGETTLYFGYDATPGADFILHIAGEFALSQFQINDPSGLTRSLSIMVRGGPGDDTFVGGPGDKLLDGGPGEDTVDYSGTTQGVVANLLVGQATGSEIGADQLISIENVIGGGGNDALTGSTMDNRLDGGAGADTLAGGSGNDTYVVDNAADIITENANEGTDTVQISLTFYQLGDNVENLTFTGTVGLNVGFGNGVDNVLMGSAGSDSLVGNFGNDTFVGGDGDDYLYIDHLDTGYDAIFVQDNTGTTLDIAAANAEWVYAWIGNDTLDASGSSVGVSMVGEAGADQLIGSAHADYIYIDNFDTLIDAGDGYDALFVYQGNGQGVINTTINVAATNAEWVLGGAGNDIITNAGDATSVTLSGGGGNDTLTGGLASDYLYGNAGADTFVVTTNAQFDAFLDFQVDIDKVDLTALTDIDDFAELAALAIQHSGNTIFNLGGGNQLFLYQVSLASLDANDFIFAP